MPDPGPAPTVTRHFVTVEGDGGQRRVHYRRAGAGPPVLLLHQSPKTSADVLPMLRLLSAGATVIAPDTPGYGLSDPLPGVARDSADIVPFADAVAATMDALGINRACVYGYHTGAAIGLKLAARHPDKVAAYVGNGVLLTTPGERADFLAHYLPPFEPAWDGGHLAWLWARLREQVIFFPWYRPTLEARMIFPMQSPERLQESALDFLSAGDDYRTAYGGALAYDKSTDIAALPVPALYVAARQDPLAVYLPKVTALAPSAARVELADTAGAAMDLAAAFIIGHLPEETVPPPTTAAVGRDGVIREFVAGEKAATLHVRRVEGRGPAALLIHPPGGSSTGLHDLLLAYRAAGRAAIAPDLPGHGESEGTPAAQIGTLAQGLARLRAAGSGDGFGELVSFSMTGVALAKSLAIRSIEIVGTAPTESDADGVQDARPPDGPNLQPDPGGGHLLAAWHHVRQRALYWPWHDTSEAGCADVVPRLDPHSLHRDVVDLLKAAPVLDEALREEARCARLFSPPVSPSVAAVSVRFWAAPWHPSRRAARQFAASRGLPYHDLPPELAAWPSMFGRP